MVPVVLGTEKVIVGVFMEVGQVVWCSGVDGVDESDFAVVACSGLLWMQKPYTPNKKIYLRISVFYQLRARLRHWFMKLTPYILGK
jgi:hypothetical protein